ncbi:Lrp/AsnC family transcriptional regulator [uncultured Traorella sp.]|uniref:Lrp/AsnC family transcriptional regulator n=1 Tax=uncultured Traorella sp. TaxID=1929048 RepID=UPI0025F50E39|nr:Lrp/AsnC family transcriptional regulator [uncultured Traorella sp.]
MEESILLSLLEKNARREVRDLADILQESEENILETMTQLEKEKVINGYHTVINWERANVDRVSALIEVSCQPERDYGYDRIASMIYSYSEVETMYLMSGRSEFIVMVEGKTMQEISNFVGSKLAVVEGVTGTSTNFVLKKYKTAGIILSDDQDDEDDRMVVTP